MKGGAIFLASASDEDIRSAAGILSESLQGGKQNYLYRSPHRVLLIQEVDQYNLPGNKEESGNLHAMLITLPEVSGSATVEYIPDSSTNFFRQHSMGGYGIVDRVMYEIKNDKGIPGVPRLVDVKGVPTRTRSRQIAALESATPRIPEVVQQRIATMSGFTSKESTPLSEAKSALAQGSPKDIKADAIIDAAIAWVKAWNAEHVAPKGKRKEATAARKTAQNALENLEEGKTKAFVPLPTEEGSSSSSSSSSSSGPAAAGAPQNGQARRKKTQRSLRKRRTTRRR